MLEHGGDVFHALAGTELFITGGTGFVGKWLVETLLYANDRLNLGVSAVMLTRDPERFREESPHLALNPAVRLLRGDPCTFECPRRNFPYVIHAASDHEIEATRHVLEFARTSGVQQLLFTSSGAVYGSQPAYITHLSEEYVGAPATAYGQAKRLSELLCALYAEHYEFSALIARLFTFTGPHLALDLNYAVGNFIGNALGGGPIQVKGDGNVYRSYLYAADLAIWLWIILVRGESARPYNVGSPDALTILELARMVVEVGGSGTPVEIGFCADPDVQSAPYVPSTMRAEKELGLRARIPVREGVRRTFNWYSLHRQQLTTI